MLLGPRDGGVQKVVREERRVRVWREENGATLKFAALTFVNREGPRRFVGWKLSKGQGIPMRKNDARNVGRMVLNHDSEIAVG
jgi:hypothetical protein